MNEGNGAPPPAPVPSPGVPQPIDKLDTGEYVALRVEAEREDKQRKREKPATHWDLVKTQVSVFGASVGLVFAFVTWGDRIVTQAKSETHSLVEQHIEAEKEVHVGIKNELTGMHVEQQVFQNRYNDDQRAMYNVILYRRPDPRFEPNVHEPGPAERSAIGVQGTSRDGGR